MLQRLQNMSLKRILKADKYTATTTIHEDLNMLTLDNRRNMHCATQMFRVQNNLVPHAIAGMFEPATDNIRRNTRREKKNNFDIPRCQLEIGKQNFRYQGPKIWEAIPPEIKTSGDITLFKKSNEKYWRGKYSNGIT